MSNVMERVIQLETMFTAIRSVTKHMPDDKEKEMILGFEKLSHEMLDTIKQLDTENEKWKDATIKRNEELDDFWLEIKQLRTENERLKDDLDIFKDNFHDERRKARRYKKALEFYEDENNYTIVESLGLSPISGKPYRNSRIGLDRGKTAKEALEQSHD